MKITTSLKNVIFLWDKVSADIKKEFDSATVYIKNFLNIKIKSHAYEVTDFHVKKILKVDSNNTCLAVIWLDSALNKDVNYYLQVFFKTVNTLTKK